MHRGWHFRHDRCRACNKVPGSGCSGVATGAVVAERNSVVAIAFSCDSSFMYGMAAFGFGVKDLLPDRLEDRDGERECAGKEDREVRIESFGPELETDIDDVQRSWARSDADAVLLALDYGHAIE